MQLQPGAELLFFGLDTILRGDHLVFLIFTAERVFALLLSAEAFAFLLVQCFQLLGGSFRRIDLVVPVATDLLNSRIRGEGGGGEKKHVTDVLFHRIYLCLCCLLRWIQVPVTFLYNTQYTAIALHRRCAGSSICPDIIPLSSFSVKPNKWRTAGSNAGFGTLKGNEILPHLLLPTTD
jgi:hypothetical protein